MRHCHLVAALVVAALAVGAARVPLHAADVPDDESSIVHALNRLTFGPRPGEVDRVRQIGLAAWIDRQLHPSRIDDAALDARLTPPLAEPASFDSPRDMRQFSRQSVDRLASEKLLRAVYSERELQEVLVDFWFNHFNVFAGKGRTGLYLGAYEREAIRPHVFGTFRDLLGATAKSPAMLFYLDNWLSSAPGSPGARRHGLNENYARELLELHTLGVDGGYTQKDIIEVARAFTGWTIGQPGQSPARRSRPSMGAVADGTFRFVPARHDRGQKRVLGHTIEAGGGVDDGERVLDIIAAHPATARHIASELARRFVSDDPPEALVARVAQRFRETHGDLREVVRAVITSPEFFAADARRAKVKTPLEFVASALRVSGRERSDMRPALRALQQLGMAPYMCQPPTGYDDRADAWVSAGALVARMNIARQLAGPQAAATVAAPEFERR